MSDRAKFFSTKYYWAIGITEHQGILSVPNFEQPELVSTLNCEQPELLSRSNY